MNLSEKQPAAKGAKWIRAALQVNPFGYKGRSTPSLKFADEHSYNIALLDRCKSQKIEMIAITDHWCVDSALQLMKDADDNGITALPGFEAVSKEGVHLLVIFEEGTSPGAINGAIGACGVTPGCGNGTTGDPYHEILTEMTKRGALVIPAHSNVPSGGMLTKRAGNPLAEMVKHADLHAIGITPSQDDGVDQESIFEGRVPYDRPHPLSKIFADDICHPSTLETEGAATWFKVSTPCLRSLKLATRMPSTRVSTVDPTLSKSRGIIRDISWEGGFLDGVKVSISSDLTAFIGGRGTGKSTVIESIRYVLAVDPIGEQAQRDHDGIVRGVLGAATSISLTVDAVSPRVGQFTVVRSVNKPALVLDSSGTVTKMKPSDVIGVVEVFGQHELAELSQDKALVARMLERFAGHEDSDEKRLDLLRELSDNRNLLGRAERELDDVDAKLADLPRLKDQLTHFEADKLGEKLDEQKRLTQDENIFTEGAERLEVARELLDQLKDGTLLSRLKADIAGIEDSPESGTLKRVQAATQKLAKAIRSASSTLEGEFEMAESEINLAQTEWDVKTQPLRAGHAAIVKKLREDGYDPEAYLTTTAAISALKAKEAAREVIKARILDLNGKRDVLLADLLLKEGEEGQRLKGAIRKANKVTNSMVNVRPITAPNRDHLKALITENVSGARTQIMAAIEGENFSTRDFVTAVRAGAANLESLYGIKGAQAVNLIGAGEGLLREFEEQHVGYAVDVYLNVAAKSGGKEFRRLDELSKGQRATALLLLLLGASSSPLVIDQPEDDLDNRFVYDGIVTKLRDLKGHRQIIVSTHNANVPVLGDAELIVTLEGDGLNGWPAVGGVGSLDDATVRELAEDLLEGGPAAFGARKHLYGF